MKIGLVLGAGGHPGYPFQVAVLDAIERRLGRDLRTADLIVGTSVGAMTGLLLRAGFGVQDLLDIAHDRTPSDVGHHLLHDVLEPPGLLPPALPGWRPPAPTLAGLPGTLRSIRGREAHCHRIPAAAAGLFPRGRASHDVLGSAADSLFPARHWPERETWVVALRQGDGGRTVFGRDVTPTSVGVAITASSAIPGFFRPTEVDGVRHVDAGIRSTTNADLLGERTDLDLVVVVPPLALDGARGRILDLPLRWLVNAQVRSEVAALEAAGIPTVVAAPDVAVARTMQGNPIRISADRVRRVLDTTATWAEDWAAQHLPHGTASSAMSATTLASAV